MSNRFIFLSKESIESVQKSNRQSTKKVSFMERLKEESSILISDDREEESVDSMERYLPRRNFEELMLCENEGREKDKSSTLSIAHGSGIIFRKERSFALKDQDSSQMYQESLFQNTEDFSNILSEKTNSLNSEQSEVKTEKKNFDDHQQRIKNQLHFEHKLSLFENCLFSQKKSSKFSKKSPKRPLIMPPNSTEDPQPIAVRLSKAFLKRVRH